MIKYFSTFSWIWAFEYAIKELWLNRNCVWFSEIDIHSIKTYKKHYPNHKNFWDITKIVASDLPNFSILLWWSPCISFSQTWKKKWFDDDNWKLFFDYIKILKEKQPKYFVFENVEWMLSNKEWESFEKIISEFDQAWYFINRKKLNSSKFWSAQNRPRVFFVWQRKDLWKNDFIFPTWINNKKYIKEILQKDVDEKYLLDGEQILNRYNWNYHSNKSQLENNTCCCLTASWTQKRIILNQTDEFRKRYYYKKLNNDELENIAGRKLTEIECERLQGFHDNYTNSWVSETQRYKQLGNSININVLKEIINSLNIYIEKNKK